MAFARAVVEEAARAGIHGRGQHEARGKSQRHGGAGDADRAILQRLAHDFEHVAGEFREFVQKEHAVVRERDFAGPRNHAAADQPGIGNGVVRRAKGTDADQARSRIEHSGHAVDLRGLERFLERERRQDGRNALGQHGLAGAGRADHQNVVAAGAGDFEGALGGLLSAHVFEVDGEMLGFVQQASLIDRNGRDAVPGVHEMNHVEQRLDRIDVTPLTMAASLAFGSGTTMREIFRPRASMAMGRAPRTPRIPPSSESSPDEEAIGDFLFVKAAICAENAERHGQIESGAFFFDVRGSQVNDDVGRRNIVSAIL